MCEKLGTKTTTEYHNGAQILLSFAAAGIAVAIIATIPLAILCIAGIVSEAYVVSLLGTILVHVVMTPGTIAAEMLILKACGELTLFRYLLDGDAFEGIRTDKKVARVGNAWWLLFEALALMALTKWGVSAVLGWKFLFQILFYAIVVAVLSIRIGRVYHQEKEGGDLE